MTFIKNYWKILLPLLFALAILLGFIRRDKLPYLSFGSKKTITHFTTPSADSLEGYYAKSQEIIKSAEAPINKVSFLAVGDIMLSRNVAGTIQKSGDVFLPFSKMADVFNSVNFSFGNLESPISGGDHFSNSGSMIFNAPTSYTEGLKKYNFKALNLANNHALDQGKNGLLYTLDFLEKLGIKTTGAGKNLEEAWQPAIVEENGIKICFIGASYSSINDSGKERNDYVARIDDAENLKSAILNHKSVCSFVVATMHAGTEYTRKPNQAQIDFAHIAIDQGADLVIGAHPHWIQTIERYNGKYIFYSLGNFIFDQEWSQETKEGLVLKIQISNFKSQNSLQGPKVPSSLESIELMPVVIENYSTPRLASPEEAKKILQKIGEQETILK